LDFVTIAERLVKVTKDVVAIATSSKRETKTRGSIGFRDNRQAVSLLSRKHVVEIDGVVRRATKSVVVIDSTIRNCHLPA